MPMTKEDFLKYQEGVCAKCDRSIVNPAGNPSSIALMIGAYPGEDEIEEGKAWVGRAGDVLKGELSRAGIGRVRLTNVWAHEETDDCDLSWHMDVLMYEMKMQKPKAVITMGALPADLFYDEPVSSITGLEVFSPYFPKSVKVSMAMVNPAIGTHGGIGEVRLAIERFAERVDKLRMEE